MDIYLSELRIFSFNYAPKGWAMCNGQLLPINQNQALFALLGTTYGGNGQTTFALPNLQGRTPIHAGGGYTRGQAGGEAAHTLSTGEMPAHTHQAVGSSNMPGANTPANNFWASGTGSSPYGNPVTGAMDGSALGSNNGGQPHQNMSPYLTVNICIALQGVFPSQN